MFYVRSEPGKSPPLTGLVWLFDSPSLLRCSKREQLAHLPSSKERGIRMSLRALKPLQRKAFIMLLTLLSGRTKPVRAFGEEGPKGLSIAYGMKGMPNLTHGINDQRNFSYEAVKL